MDQTKNREEEEEEAAPDALPPPPPALQPSEEATAQVDQFLRSDLQESADDRKEECNRARVRIFNSTNSNGANSNASCRTISKSCEEQRLPDSLHNCGFVEPDLNELASNLISSFSSNLNSNREANNGASSTRNKGDEEVGISRTRSGGACVAIFRDRDIDRKDPDYDCSYDRYMKRSDPAFGFNGGSYPMQQLYVPAVNYNTEFVHLVSAPRSPHQLSIDAPQQGFHPEYLKLLIPYNMKRSIRIPLAFSLLITIFSLISLFSITFLHPPNSMFYWVPRHNKLYTLPAPTPSNFTAELRRLANSDPGGESLKKGIQDMLEGNLPLRRDQIRRHEPYTHHRLRWDPWDNDHVPHRLHSPKDYRNRIRVVPELRRLLRARIWSNNRRYNLSDLLNLPIGLESKPGKKYSSCAVVGNSGILLNSNHGEEIDRHDLVIRLNNARINGYEYHVGSRTGLSFINSHILIQCAKKAGCFCHPYGENVPILMYFCQASHFIDYLACNSSSGKNRAPLLITDPGFDALCARIVKFYSLKRYAEESGQTGQLLVNWGKIHNEKLFHYSSGFQAVMVALGICDRVSLFGFGKSDKVKHHYHTNQKKELDLHDYSAEYMIYRDLAQRPEAIPFLSDLGFKVPSVQIHF